MIAWKLLIFVALHFLLYAKGRPFVSVFVLFSDLMSGWLCAIDCIADESIGMSAAVLSN